MIKYFCDICEKQTISGLNKLTRYNELYSTPDEIEVCWECREKLIQGRIDSDARIEQCIRENGGNNNE